MKPIRIFIVDDHPLMRTALKMTIEAAADMCSAGEAANGAEALQLIPTAKPDVVLMDLMMPEMSGLEAIRALIQSQPGIRILVLSSLEKKAEILSAIQSGAMGYVTKNAQRDELLQAIRTVNAGAAHLSPKIAAQILSTMKGVQPGEGKLPEIEAALTRRQKNVLDLMGQGYSNSQIAEVLHIAEATLRVHISNMMAILEFEHLRELVVYAVKQYQE